MEMGVVGNWEESSLITSVGWKLEYRLAQSLSCWSGLVESGG